MADNLPGIDEAMEWLKRQNAAVEAERIKKSQVPNMSGQAKTVQVGTPIEPAGPTGAFGKPVLPPGTKSPVSVGNFSKTVAKGAGKVGKAAGPIGTAAMVYGALEPVASSIGNSIGDSYYENEMQKAYGSKAKPNLAVQALTGEEAPGLSPRKQVSSPGNSLDLAMRGPRTPERGNASAPREDMEDLGDEQASGPIKFHRPLSPEEIARDNQVQAEPEQAVATESPEESDPLMDKLVELMSAPEYKAPREEINPASLKAMNELGQNASERPKEKGGFLRGLQKVLVAGSGPLDFTRRDRQEEDLHQAKNQMTQREQYRGQNAQRDVQGAQQFNRVAEMQDYESGGMSPQQKFFMDLLHGDRKGATAGKMRASEQVREHGFRMEELKSNAASQKLTPEAIKEQARAKFATEYPDADPELMQALGINMTPESVQSIQKGRIHGQDPMQMLMAIEAIRAGRTATPSKKPAPENMNLKALK